MQLNPLIKLDDRDSSAQTSEINKISFKSTAPKYSGE